MDGLAHSRTGIPTFSSELLEGTVQYELYIMIFKQLLASLEASKSTGRKVSWVVIYSQGNFLKMRG